MPYSSYLPLNLLLQSSINQSSINQTMLWLVKKPKEITGVILYPLKYNLIILPFLLSFSFHDNHGPKKVTLKGHVSFLHMMITEHGFPSSLQYSSAGEGSLLKLACILLKSYQVSPAANSSFSLHLLHLFVSYPPIASVSTRSGKTIE